MARFEDTAMGAGGLDAFRIRRANDQTGRGGLHRPAALQRAGPGLTGYLLLGKFFRACGARSLISRFLVGIFENTAIWTYAQFPVFAIALNIHFVSLLPVFIREFNLDNL